MRQPFANGTWLETSRHFDGNIAGRALCPDGKVRMLKRIALSADTFFSIPAAVTYKGKTVTGFVMPQMKRDEDVNTLVFVPYKYCKHGHIFDEEVNS